MNANDAGASVAEGATRLAKAMQYKRSLEAAAKPGQPQKSTASSRSQVDFLIKLAFNAGG